jgi:hypothetical protein
LRLFLDLFLDDRLFLDERRLFLDLLQVFLDLDLRVPLLHLLRLDFLCFFPLSERVLRLFLDLFLDERRTFLDERRTFLDERRTFLDERRTFLDERRTFLDKRRTFLDKRLERLPKLFLQVFPDLDLLLPRLQRFLLTLDFAIFVDIVYILQRKYFSLNFYFLIFKR